MNQKYQKVLAGEKAIKKRLFSLFIVQGSKVGSATNKQGAVPNGAESPVILRPEELCVLPSQQEQHWGCGLGTAGLCGSNLADNFLLRFRVIELTSMETGSQTRANGIAGSAYCHSSDSTRD